MGVDLVSGAGAGPGGGTPAGGRGAAGRAARLLGRAGLLVLLLGVGVVVWIAWPLPEDVARPGPVPGLVLEDRYGRILRTTRAPDGSRGGWVPLSELDPELIQAFIAAEDRGCCEGRCGVLRAVGRAVRDHPAAVRLVGGESTSTLQLARLRRLVPRRWAGKLKQALWALGIEAPPD